MLSVRVCQRSCPPETRHAGRGSSLSPPPRGDSTRLLSQFLLRCWVRSVALAEAAAGRPIPVHRISRLRRATRRYPPLPVPGSPAQQARCVHQSLDENLKFTTITPIAVGSAVQSVPLRIVASERLRILEQLTMKTYSACEVWKDDAARAPYFTGAAPHAHIDSGPAKTDSNASASFPVSYVEKMHIPSLIHAQGAVDSRDAILMHMVLDSSDSDAVTTSADDGAMSISPVTDKATTEEQRRQRRNERERKRIQGHRETRAKLREDVKELQTKLNRLQSRLEQSSALTGSHNSMDSLWLQSIEKRFHGDAASMEREHWEDLSDESKLQFYLALVKEANRLKDEKLMLDSRVRADAVTLTAVGTLVSGLSENGSMERTKQETRGETYDHQSDPMTRLVAHDDFIDGSLKVVIDPITILDEMLKSDPLSAQEATDLVAETCREMMQAQAETQDGWAGNTTSPFGWAVRTREDMDGKRLQFKLSQTFQSVAANELMQKTWQMLTNLEDYRQIQPHTQQLRVLQRVNDECWVVGFAVGQRTHRRHSLILVARAVIYGGYLITFRSLPLLRRGSGGSEAMRRRFLNQEAGGMYVDIYSWYNFQERPSQSGDGMECEVIFGGTARNGNTHFLKQLQVEVLAGISHWQAAIGLPQVAMPRLVESQDEEEDAELCLKEEQVRR